MKESTEANAPSRQEMHAIARKRIKEISKEFKEGFEFLEDYPKSVTFFGANQFNEDNPYCQSARTLSARLVKEHGYTIISGGGPGVMEAANRGAFEIGGQSLGILIDLEEKQLVNKYLTGGFSAHYFFVRKVCLALSADAFIFFPGGFGTMDEFFEILTLIQTKKITHVPLICVGSEYWNKLKDFMEQEMLTRGAVTTENLDLFKIIDDHDEVIDLIVKSV